VTRVVAEGLSELHARGLCHLDIHPSNIMRFGSDWKIIDLEACLPDCADSMLCREQPDALPLYASPELANAFLAASASRMMGPAPSRKSKAGGATTSATKSRSKESPGAQTKELQVPPSPKQDLWSAGVLVLDTLAHKRSLEATYWQVQKEFRSDDKESRSDSDAADIHESWYRWVSSRNKIDVYNHVLEPKASLDMLRNSADLRNLLAGLLDKEASTRISAEDFKLHPWLTEARKDALMRLGALQTTKAPEASGDKPPRRSQTGPAVASQVQQVSNLCKEESAESRRGAESQTASRRSTSPSPALVHLALSRGVDVAEIIPPGAHPGIAKAPDFEPPSPAALPMPKVQFGVREKAADETAALSPEEHAHGCLDGRSADVGHTSATPCPSPPTTLRAATVASPGSCSATLPASMETTVKPFRIADPRQPEEEISVIAFPSLMTSADAANAGNHASSSIHELLLASAFLSPGFDVGQTKPLEVQAPRSPGCCRRFQNVDAAFQALRSWDRAAELESLSAEAALKWGQQLQTEDRSYGGYGGKWTGMLAILCEKFAPNSLWSEALMGTGDAFLLNHGNAGLEPSLWADRGDGSGRNWLGMQLMLVRDTLQECGGNKSRRKLRSWTDFIRSSAGFNLQTGEVTTSEGATQWQDVVTRANLAARERMETMALGPTPAGKADISEKDSLAEVVSSLAQALQHRHGNGGGDDGSAVLAAVLSSIQLHDPDREGLIDARLCFQLLQEADATCTDIALRRMVAVSRSQRQEQIDYPSLVRWILSASTVTTLTEVASEAREKEEEIRGVVNSSKQLFITTCAEKTQGSVALVLELLHVMNTQADAVNGSRETGKMIISPGVDQIAIVAYVPEALRRDASSAEWLHCVLNKCGGEPLALADDVSSGYVLLKPHDGQAKIKEVDDLMRAANDFLSERGLSPPKRQNEVEHLE